MLQDVLKSGRPIKMAVGGATLVLSSVGTQPLDKWLGVSPTFTIWHKEERSSNLKMVHERPFLPIPTGLSCPDRAKSGVLPWRSGARAFACVAFNPNQPKMNRLGGYAARSLAAPEQHPELSRPGQP